MATFEEFRLLLVLYYDANLISDEDFLLLYEMFPSKNPIFPYDKYSSCDMDNMSEAESKAEFRFNKNDLPVLAEALQIPLSFKLNQGSKVDGMERLGFTTTCLLFQIWCYGASFWQSSTCYKHGRKSCNWFYSWTPLFRSPKFEITGFWNNQESVIFETMNISFK